MSLRPATLGRVLLALACAAAAAHPLGAAGRDRAVSETAAAATSSDAGVRRVPPISVPGAPRSLVSLAVPLPSGLDLSGAIEYRVERSGLCDVLGRLEGRVGGVEPARYGGQVLLTIRVPADAKVGLLDVADVVFSDAAGNVVVLPIILRVPAVRAVRLVLPPPMADLQAGDRLELTFQLVNDGNAPERVMVDFEAPSGWPLRSPRTPVVAIGPFETREVALRLQVPAGVSGGEVSVPVRVRELATGDSAVIASGFARLSLATPEFRAPGLQFVPFAAAASSAAGTSFASGFRLQGLVSDGVRMSLEVQPRPFGAEGSFAGLGAVGAFVQPLQLNLSAANWSATAGNASGSVTALPGAFVNGDGVRADLRTASGREWGIIAARPISSSRREGQMLALRSSWRRGESQLSASVSHLQERGSGIVLRDLTALAAEWSSPDVRDWDLTAGAALRHSSFGSGVGMHARARRSFERGSMGAYATFAPGGSESYANARLTAGGDFTRELTQRLQVDGSATIWNDRTSAVGTMRSRTVSLGNRFAVNDITSLSLRASNTALAVESRGIVGGFGSSESSLEGGVSRQVGAWDLTASSRLGLVERSTELLGGRESVIRVPQQHHALQANLSLPSLGAVGLGGGRTTTEQGAGIPAVMHNVFVSFNGAPRAIGPHSLSLRARSTYMMATGQGGGAITTLAASFRTAGGWEVLSSVERNDLLRTATGRSNVFFALRVAATTEVLVPRPLLKVAGVVFNDLNDNGRRDMGEPGIGGVVLRVDGVRIVSEPDGVYRVPANVRGQIRLDPMGLPRGLVLRAASGTPRRERGDIPLRQTGTLTLNLNIAADREGVRPDIDLSKVDVWLTDASGIEWVGRSDIPGEVIFDNIPAGRYAFRFDFSRVGEPLRGEEGAMVEVAPDVTRSVTVTLRARDVRLIDPPGRGGTGRGGRGGAGGRGLRQ